MTGNDITVSVSPLVGLDALEAKWLCLESRANPSFFQTWSWIGSWLNRAEFLTPPRVIEATRDGSRVGLGILAARRTFRSPILIGRRLHLNETGDPNYDLIAIEHNGLLADRDHVADVEVACLRWLVENDRTWNELYLGGVPLRYAEFAESLGLRASIRVVQPCPTVDLAGLQSIDDLLAQLSRNTRRQYLQSLRFYEARGELRVDAAKDIPQAHAFLADLKRLHVMRWQSLGRAHAFRAPFFERFHAALIARCLPEEKVELLRVSAGGDAIAYLYNLLFGGQVYNYQCGFAYESSSRARPGLVSQIMAIERAIARGAHAYDLLAGATRFKSNIASSEKSIAWMTLRRESGLLRVESAIRSFMRRFDTRLR